MNNENVQNMANEITGITDSLCDENQKDREHRLGPNFFSNQTLKDKTIYSIKPTFYNMRITLLYSQNIIMNISRVLEALVLPYSIKIDAGYAAKTPENTNYLFHPSRNSALDLSNVFMQEKSDVDQFLNDLGWFYTPHKTAPRNDSKFFDLIISKHDELFEIYSHSHFVLHEVSHIDLYIQCSATLLEKWE